MIKTLEHVHYNESTKEIEGHSERDLEQIREWIKGHYVVILRNAFKKELVEKIRNAVFHYFQEVPESNPAVNEQTPNYHRIDNNPPKSAVKRINHNLASFYWNKDIAGETDLMRAMSGFKNQVAGLPRGFALHQIEQAYGSEWITVPNVIQYPLGGGRLNKHQDPVNIQFTTILASMSQKGTDFHEGGLYIEMANKKINLDDHLKIGDIYMIRPEVIHGVDDIDKNLWSEVQWNNPGGRWALFPTLVELKSTRGEKVEGLRDLEQY